jgi:hypothetical protein
VLNVADMLVNQDIGSSGIIQNAGAETVALANAPTSGLFIHKLASRS